MTLDGILLAVASIALAVFLVSVALAEAHHCTTRSCAEIKASYTACSKIRPVTHTRITKCHIRRAAAHYGQSATTGYRMAYCESRFNWRAYNPSGASGLFQFMPGTWGTTPYGHRSIWNPRYQALAWGWMLAQGRRGEWVCQ